MKVMSQGWATAHGYSADKRKRRNQHRDAARKLTNGGTLLNPRAPRGSTPGQMAAWHLFQARWVGR